MQSDQPTRRKMLATIATVAAGAAVTALPALAVAGDHDAELFALERELKAAHARMLKACELTNETAERSYGNRPPQPERPGMPEEYAKMYEAITVGEVSLLRKVRPDHPIVVWQNETEATFKAQLAEHWAACVKLDRESGHEAADAAFTDRMNELYAISARIFATRATTLAGMAVKIRTYDLLDMDEDPDNGGFESLAADILAMSGAAA
jgi:hypothetical protein